MFFNITLTVTTNLEPSYNFVHEACILLYGIIGRFHRRRSVTSQPFSDLEPQVDPQERRDPCTWEQHPSSSFHYSKNYLSTGVYLYVEWPQETVTDGFREYPPKSTYQGDSIEGGPSRHNLFRTGNPRQTPRSAATHAPGSSTHPVVSITVKTISQRGLIFTWNGPIDPLRPGDSIAFGALNTYVASLCRCVQSIGCDCIFGL